MPDLLHTLFSFLLTLAILVVFHELGHYTVARLFGIKILEFSVGFGRKLVSRPFGRDGTQWSLAAIPLGGFVKMLDENEGEVAPADRHRAFNRQTVFVRSMVVLAGPVANFLLAILLFWVLYVVGVFGIRPLVNQPPAHSAAAMAGLEKSDEITAVGDTPVRSWQEFRWALLRQVGKESVELTVARSGGVSFHRTLSLDGLQAGDLDGDFLDRLGLSLLEPEIEPVVATVEPGSPAEAAGMRAGDRVLSVGGRRVDYWQDIGRLLGPAADTDVIVVVERGGEEKQLVVRPRPTAEGGKAGIRPVMKEGMFDNYVVRVDYSPGVALVRAVQRSWEMSAFTLEMLARMLIGEVSLKNLSGPITIADYAGQSASLGWVSYLNFLAIISISLGVLNLLPIPLLDGGHLMYYMAELIKGGPLSERAMEIGQQIGIAILLVLMTFAFYNDINRLLTG